MTYYQQQKLYREAWKAYREALAEADDIISIAAEQFRMRCEAINGARQ